MSVNGMAITWSTSLTPSPPPSPSTCPGLAQIHYHLISGAQVIGERERPPPAPSQLWPLVPRPARIRSRGRTSRDLT